jgi:CelD/BcsL family acetyltransferase involved in cellulose biosynthesis
VNDVAVLPLRFQVGARTLASIPRRLVRVSYSLQTVLAGHVTAIGQPTPSSDGFLVTSMPESQLERVGTAGLLRHVRQRYMRYYVDLSTGMAGWEAALSGATRSGLKRKAKKLVAASGGTLDVRRYVSADEIATFHPLARAVSALTYQERLLDAGLPSDAGELLRLAAADRVRAWLLFLEERPVAYLCCTADGDTIRYDYVGHDPAIASLSPGVVLQAEALRDLMKEGRFRWFDFTEGEGQHKRSLATGGVACMDVLLLRATLVNRVALRALGGFDSAVAVAKRAAAHPTLARLSRQVRR